jgi:acyl dehydratase
VRETRDTQTIAPPPTELDVNYIVEATGFGLPYGGFTRFEDIEVGKESEPVEWTITDDAIDAYCALQDEPHEWFAIDSPFGGRVAPLIAASMIFRAIYPAKVGGLFTGWEARMHDVLRPNVPYVWQARVADKWIRKDREWVAMEGTCHDPHGKLIYWTKRIHVIDFKRISERGDADIVLPKPDQVVEAEDYTPLALRKRVPEEWARDLKEFPVSDAHYGHPDMPIGQSLVPMSRQYMWRKARDHAEILYSYIFGWPRWKAAFSFHVHPEAAADKGLARPNVSGLDPTTLISQMMLALVGQGWLLGGEFTYRIMHQISVDDFITAKGTLIDKREEGPNLRLVCEIWCENQRGEKVFTGEASGVIPR